MLGEKWQTSSHSDDKLCVRARRGPDGMVEVGDSKDPDGKPLRFTPEEWTAFLDGAEEFRP